MGDLCIYDVGKNRWEAMPNSRHMARSRMNHAAAMLGCLMLIQGGYTSESKKTLGEFHLFDMIANRWIDCIWDGEIQPRQMHTMKGVYDAMLHEKHVPPRMQHRAMWVKPRASFKKEEGEFFRNDKLQEGYYIFGGQDAKGKMLNDFWLAQPDYD
jgi:hypothetical protein